MVLRFESRPTNQVVLAGIAWAPMLAVPFVDARAWPAVWPAWAHFYTTSALLFASFKWLTWRSAETSGVALWQRFAYVFAWHGLSVEEFVRPAPDPSVARPTLWQWAGALAQMAAGAAILWGGFISIPSHQVMVRAWFGIVGLSLIILFGIANLATCLWRQFGYFAKPLMNWPLLSTSVSDFWSGRWNRSFHQMARNIVFRKVALRFGARSGLLAVFLFSGILHELIISVPAKGGYGLPTLYLLLQGVGIAIERSSFGRAMGLGRGVRGYIFCQITILLTLPLLCHKKFLREVAAPFLDAIGALTP